MRIKTANLTGPALDWAVAKCEGILTPIHGEPVPRVVLYSDQWQKYMRLNPPPQVYYSDRYEPSTDWSQGGPIVEREWIELENGSDLHPDLWGAIKYDEGGEPATARGPTPLIAALRCFVASKLGDEVEIPEELL